VTKLEILDRIRRNFYQIKKEGFFLWGPYFLILEGAEFKK
jgi:hypothetical protein